MRKIRRNEIKPVSKQFADIFADYELYDLISQHKSRRKRIMYLFFYYEIYTTAPFVYTNDDAYTAICSIKRPYEKENSTFSLFLNPFFLLPFIVVTGRKALKLAAEYIKYAKSFAKDYYYPDTDCYIKNIGVDAVARGQGYLKKMLEEICGDKPIFLETHSATNVEIYKKLGFEIAAIGDFHGCMHYAMKRPAR